MVRLGGNTSLFLGEELSEDGVRALMNAGLPTRFSQECGVWKEKAIASRKAKEEKIMVEEAQLRRSLDSMAADLKEVLLAALVNGTLSRYA